MLKRQFDLDDDYLDDLKYELIEIQQLVVDQAGKMLVWAGDPVPPEPDIQRWADAGSRFHLLLPEVLAFLQRNRRVSYRRLQHIFGIDDALLEELRKEFTFQQVARDEQGEGLVWTSDTQPVEAPASPPAIQDVVAVPSTQTSDTAADASAFSPAHTRNAPEAERRQLTVMFCDLADSTRLSQQLDPEDLRDVIRAYQQTCAEVIKHYDGYVAQHLGDGLLIYFGWPQAHEDDAQRALHAGLGIVDAITTRLNPHLEQEQGVRLTVRLGVHTGPVVVGEMGGGGRHEKLATGETVNIAARMEGLAAPNTVVISSVTERLVRHAFVLQDLGPHELKGVVEPMPVLRVLGPKQEHGDETTAVGLPFLVGRDEEVGLLLRRWEQIKEGLGHVVLISGEAGIGKSSLLAAACHHVTHEGYTRLTFRCSPYHTNSALYPVTTHLEQILAFDRDDSPGVKLDKLEQALRSTTLALHEAVPLLAMLLSIPFEIRYPALPLSPQQQRQQTMDTLVGWLLDKAEQQPVLVVWEDLHWVDPSTLEMLGLVLEQTPTVPMLHLMTFRPAFEVPWPTRSHMTPVTLNRLERPQVEALIMHLVGGKALPVEVIEHIITKTDGVPLYVEELTKMLRESDLLQETAEHYVLRGSLATVAIPDTLQDSLMARLDRLSTAKEVAQLGAVLGREFSYELIQAISPLDEAALQSGLQRLVDAELLYQRGRPPRARYLFKHALVQDAAYVSLLARRRRELHQAVGNAIETHDPNRLADYDAELSHHFTLGEVWPKAMTYSTLAGDRAADAQAYAEARAHYTSALEAAAQLDPPPDPIILANLHEKHATALAFFIEYDAAAAEYQHALALVRQVGERQRESEFLAKLSLVYNFAHHPDPAMACVDQALTIAQELDDRPTQALCLIHRAEARVNYYGQIADVLSDSEAALCLARAVGDPKLLAHTLTLFGGFLELTADLDRSLAYQYEAAELAQRVRSAFDISHSAMFIGFASIAKCAYEEASQWLQRLQDYASEIKDAAWMSRVPNTIAAIPLELYDLDEAIEQNLEAADVAQRLWPWPEPRAHALLKVGLAYLERDEHGLADKFFRRTWSLLEDDLFLRWRWHIPLLHARGALALREGQHDEAWRFATESLNMATQTGSRKHVARAQRLQGEILLARGKPEDAIQILRSSIHLAEQIGTPREVWLGKAALGKELMRRNQDNEAETQLTQAAQTLEAIAAGLRTPRWRDSLLSAAPVVELYDTLGRPPQGIGA
jgi:class 3 adenylate cyclase/tetratricopeptide (TPR) repeat protein